MFFKELKNVSVELYNNPKTLNLNRFMQTLMKGYLKEYVSLYIYYKLTEQSFFKGVNKREKLILKVNKNKIN